MGGGGRGATSGAGGGGTYGGAPSDAAVGASGAPPTSGKPAGRPARGPRRVVAVEQRQSHRRRRLVPKFHSKHPPAWISALRTMGPPPPSPPRAPARTRVMIAQHDFRHGPGREVPNI